MGAAVLAGCAGAPTAAPAATEAPKVEEKPTEAPAATAAPPSGEVVTLTFWKGPHKAAGDETKLCAGPTLEKFMAQYPSIKVEFQEVPWSGYNEKFSAAFAAGQPPDVSYQTESFPTFVKAGNILPLDELIAESGFDLKVMLERAIEIVTYDGKIYAMPWIEGGSILMWNKELFEKAGLDPETPPDTMEQFVDYALKIRALGDDIYGYAVGPRDWHENGYWGIRWGGQWFNKDYTQCLADSKEFIEGYQFMADLFFKHQVAMPAAITGQEPGAYGYFRDGKVGMTTYQSIVANSLRRDNPNLKLGGAFVPKGPADEPAGRAAYGGVGALAIAKASKHVKEAWTLVQWLVTPDALKSWLGCLGFATARSDVFLFQDDPVLSVGETGRKFHFFWPYTEWVFKFWDIEATYIEAIQLGQMKVDEALKELTAKVNDILKEAQQA
jgi:ABC-type glycerol-3-phosphate transport system substrate-binding protein